MDEQHENEMWNRHARQLQRLERYERRRREWARLCARIDRLEREHPVLYFLLIYGTGIELSLAAVLLVRLTEAP